MNDRERFLATMHYETRDRATIGDMSFWPETIAAWKQQGLPEWVYWQSYEDNTTNKFFGMDCYRTYTGVKFDLTPAFEEKVIEDRGSEELVQQADGVRVLRRKVMSSIPLHDRHLLVDRQSWKRHYKPRLDPDDPKRYPRDWDRCVKVWTNSERDFPVVVEGGSLYGWLRNWMGLEQVSLLVYDDPKLFEDMVTTIADCVLGILGRVFSTNGRFDACYFWEDMCYKNGSLLSPQHFKRYLLPHYRRITDLCHEQGIDVICLDCDGSIEELIPLWLDGGVNCLYPIEVGDGANDPIDLRRRFGKDLRMMGGFNKRILAQSKRDVEREVHRLAPLVHEGGYMGCCDHYVPPDVSLDNYFFYCQTVRQVWYDNVNLMPLGQLEDFKEQD